MIADLHVHSTASDGIFTPTEVVAAAARRGVGVMALCDHDTVDGVAEARAAAERLDIDLIPSLEFSAAHEGHDIHILGYFVDIENATLLAKLEHLRSVRATRVERIVGELRQDGFSITLEDVRALGEGTLGRAHVARVLVEKGHASDIGDAFARYVGEGAPYFLPKAFLTAQEVLELVHSAGGIPVLAHPWRSDAVDHIPELVAMGMRGLEAFHSEQTAQEAAAIVEIAEAMDLLVTGGSDWHGDGPRSTWVGDVDYPERHLQRFLAAGRRE